MGWGGNVGYSEDKSFLVLDNNNFFPLHYRKSPNIHGILIYITSLDPHNTNVIALSV